MAGKILLMGGYSKLVTYILVLVVSIEDCHTLLQGGDP